MVPHVPLALLAGESAPFSEVAQGRLHPSVQPGQWVGPMALLCVASLGHWEYWFWNPRSQICSLLLPPLPWLDVTSGRAPFLVSVSPSAKWAENL